jgi:hypothetical protein
MMPQRRAEHTSFFIPRLSLSQLTNILLAGGDMIKICGLLAILFILVLPCSAQDYLEGGYVSSGNGDMAQYFTDPIFRSPSGSYVSPDPAVRGMQ